MGDILANATQLGSIFFLGLLQPLWKLWITKRHNYPSSESKLVQPIHQPLQCKKGQDDGTLLCKDEVQMVMGRLGICCEEEGDDITIGDKIGAEDLSRVFFEVEPSLEEMKEAFAVFDENRDGFIGASDLLRVLGHLGLKERFGLEECQTMINAADMNQDELIDFEEFVKHMDNCV